MATSVVQASIYSNLVHQGLTCIAEISNQELTTNQDLTEPGKRKLESIINVTKSCLKTNSIANAKFQKCSTYIKRGCKDIADREVNMINKAIQNNENPSYISHIHFYEPSMHDLHVTLSQQSSNSKRHPSIPIHQEEVTETVGTQSDLQRTFVSFDSTVMNSSSCQVPTDPTTPPTTIPHPRPNSFHTPLDAIRIVTAYASKTKRYLPDFPPDKRGCYTRPLSYHMIMQYMINKSHVPIWSTAFRKLLNTYLSTKRLPAYTWTEITAPGRKPHIPPDQLNSMLTNIKTKTDGGHSMDRSTIQSDIENKIKLNWSENNETRYRHNTIPPTTMKRYIHRIMSHPSLNIQTAVSNKTESRSSAEWSIRSTVSYAVVVMATHFVYAEPSQFHPKLTSLDPSIT